MLAIHQEGKCFEDRWSDRWISTCLELGIPHKLVNCYSNEIVSDISGCYGLMWHWNQQDSRGALFARQLFLSLNAAGIETFPDLGSVWHHDDKVGQKYFLEALGAPLVPSYVFYQRETALLWCEKAVFPKVFKLRGGAGSVNVKLAKSKKDAIRLIDKAFGAGFLPVDRWSRLKDRIWRFKRDRNLAALRGLLGGVARVFFPNQVESGYSRERGYAYFQDFIPGNSFDIRLIVIGNRCFGLRRFNREGDFRASGSGVVDYNPAEINLEAVRISFEIARKIGARSMAFDFLETPKGPVIVEISYCYVMGSVYDNCPGYWNSEIEWKAVPVDPQRFILEDFVASMKSKGFSS